ncbi:MAG: enoyl-CoA hydratase/isomerase family protein [Gammaproteobacteria bacterium]|nr:enoyl-CoA hydratase/isomerase family protein [Gammaproteobacteria bacterium]MDD9895425.1 enoyl-CoA hydratase/isomerase family protein [Gammaproteobacteria bacterium]MDD9957559.1 enoyl-CoA hydratase/isomerase family protein [Gammaproteobacteria bacterium]
MSFNFLTVERDDQIAQITLRRPECGNALSLALMREITTAANSFKYDTDTRVVIFRGEGKHFCVGADLKDDERWQANESGDLLTRTRLTQVGRDLLESILGINQVTIAVIQGAAAGGGACIPTACDFRIGADDCIIGYPEVKLSMNLSWGALPLCYNLVGPAIAKRMVIGGDLEKAEDLLKWGFLDETVTAEKLESRALEMAEYYASRPALAAQMIKRGINALQLANAGIMHMDGDQNALATLSEEFIQARDAFLNK